jgi:nucleoside triphosphate diphosphatase
VNDTQENHPLPGSAAGGSLDRALALVEFLRAHCPWDAAQTPITLLRHLVEETYEVVDAVVREDDEALRDELGDLLLNVAFQVVLGEERGGLARQDVVRRLEDKMRRRHPHLFGLGPAEDWEAIKARERAERHPTGEAGRPEKSLLDDLARGMDPLLRAHRMQEIVARVGFDWPDALEAEIGDLLFSAVNLARRAGVHAPAALARTNAKFVRRFQAVEALAARRGTPLDDMNLDAMDALWDEVKRAERDSTASDA